MENELERLKIGLELSLSKKTRKDGNKVSSSIAYSESDRSYLAGSLASDTNLLDFSSEQAALIVASHNNDFKINQVVTLFIDETHQTLSPIVIKLLIDHSLRTGADISYKIINLDGKIIFEEKNVRNIFPFYTPQLSKLEKIDSSEISENIAIINKDEKTEDVLKKYALLGIERNFPTYDSASGYGTAIITNKNKIYFGGQYSDPGKRLNAHSEMATFIDVLVNKEQEHITHLGIVSSKYTDTPCEICGCCRQFLSEVSSKYNLDIKFFCFAKNTEEYNRYTINQLMPNQWSSKKW